MYAWQTLTLARVQFRGRSTRCLATVKDVLYLIGLNHFPEPEVTEAFDGASMRWCVDGRTLVVTVNTRGVVEYGQIISMEQGAFSSGGVDLQSDSGRQEVSGLVSWLLFGESNLTPIEPEARSGKPACVEDLEKAIREEANRREKLSLKKASDDAARRLMTNIY